MEVPYRGDVNATVLDVLGGIRSACTYTGAGKLKEMPKRTTFIRVSQQLNEIFSGGNIIKMKFIKILNLTEIAETSAPSRYTNGASKRKHSETESNGKH